jgi:hypothetical protein
VTAGNLDITDELLVAYVDDELDPDQREMVRSVLATHPALSRRADEMRLARDLLSEAFPLRADASVPAPIEAAANRLAEACARRSSRKPVVSSARHWRKYAVAAGIALPLLGTALYLVWRNGDGSDGDPVTALMDVDPGTPLYGLLESTASAEVINVPGEHAALRAVLTFRAKDGRFCREFEILAGTRGASGVACRDHGEWHAEALMSAAAAPASSNYYTPAGSSDEPAVARVIDRLIQGDPLGLPEEAGLLANGWKTTDTP